MMKQLGDTKMRVLTVNGKPLEEVGDLELVKACTAAVPVKLTVSEVVVTCSSVFTEFLFPYLSVLPEIEEVKLQGEIAEFRLLVSPDGVTGSGPVEVQAWVRGYEVTGEGKW